MLEIFSIPALKDNYIWCIVNPGNRHCLVIDPGQDHPVTQTLQQNHLTLSAILVTHHHWDHTAGIEALVQKFDVPIFGPGKNLNVQNNILKEGDIVTLETLDLQIATLSIPGHTLDHVAYYIKNALFSGDTLFTGGCGRVFEGTMPQMLKALDKLRDFADETLVYCGHEYTEINLTFAQLVEPNNSVLHNRIAETHIARQKGFPTVPSTLYLEKMTNPFLRVDCPEVIASAEKFAGKALNDRCEVFTALREWKNQS